MRDSFQRSMKRPRRRFFNPHLGSDKVLSASAVPKAAYSFWLKARELDYPSHLVRLLLIYRPHFKLVFNHVQRATP